MGFNDEERSIESGASMLLYRVYANVSSSVLRFIGFREV